MPPPAFLHLSLLLLLLGCGTAQAQIRRCTGSDGTTIYTDRRCQDLGAVERIPDASGARRGRMAANTCPRNLQDLIYQLSDAIGSRDVNRLASVYYWAGQSTRNGYALMRRLDAIAQRPLADIVPVYPRRADTYPNADGDSDDGTGMAYPQTTVQQAPIGLRLEQTLANGSTPSRTFLGLRRAYGCWWVSL
jgi:hypothetical protein